MSVSAWRPVLETSCIASAAREGSEACARGGGVGQRDHHLDVVRDHVVHLPRDASPFRGRGQRCLLVALELQSFGAFGQPVEVAAQRAHDDPGQQRGEGRVR